MAEDSQKEPMMPWKLAIVLLLIIAAPRDGFQITPSVEEALYLRPGVSETRTFKTLPNRYLPANYSTADLKKLVEEFLVAVQNAYPPGRQDIPVSLDGIKQLSDRFDKIIYFEIVETPAATSSGGGAEKRVSILPKMVDEHGLRSSKRYSVLPLLQGGYRCQLLTIQYDDSVKKWLFYSPETRQRVTQTTCSAIMPKKLIVIPICSASRVKASDSERQQIQKQLESALNQEIEAVAHEHFPNVMTAAQQEEQFYKSSSPATQASYARVYDFVLRVEMM